MGNNGFHKILICFFTIYCGVCSAQITKITFTNPEPDLSIIGVNTRLRKHPVSLTGFRAGVIFNDKFSTGIAYAWLPKDLDEDIIVNGNPVSGRLHFYYGSVYAEYHFFDTKKWKLSSGLMPGAGTVYNVVNTDRRNQHNVFLLEPFVNATYKIRDVVGIGASVGYRFVPFGFIDGTSDLQAPWVTIGFSVFFAEVYKNYVKGDGLKTL
ncbi:MAG: hypothetical protein NTX03_14420 [Bacteroidetes bacterium]|nr:hypothetical protein [Bacteroidota bacterium]